MDPELKQALAQLEDRLTARIDHLDGRLTARIDGVETRLRTYIEERSEATETKLLTCLSQLGANL